MTDARTRKVSAEAFVNEHWEEIIEGYSRYPCR